LIYAADAPAAAAPEPAVPSPVLRPGSPAKAPKTIPGTNLWRVSLAALAAANALDVQSSWGKHELNPNLGGPAGTFGTQGTLLKLGFQGGLVGVEYLFTHHRPSPRLYRALALINFGASAGIAGVAAHNYTVAPPGR
jgi:hypothetical protein